MADPLLADALGMPTASVPEEADDAQLDPLTEKRMRSRVSELCSRIDAAKAALEQEFVAADPPPTHTHTHTHTTTTHTDWTPSWSAPAPTS